MICMGSLYNGAISPALRQSAHPFIAEQSPSRPHPGAGPLAGGAPINGPRP